MELNYLSITKKLLTIVLRVLLKKALDLVSFALKRISGLVILVLYIRAVNILLVYFFVK